MRCLPRHPQRLRLTQPYPSRYPAFTPSYAPSVLGRPQRSELTTFSLSCQEPENGQSAAIRFASATDPGENPCPTAA